MKKAVFVLAALFLLAASLPALAVEPVSYVVYDTLPTYFSTIEDGMKALSSIRDQIATDSGEMKSANLSSQAFTIHGTAGAPLSIQFASLTLIRLFEVPKAPEPYRWGIGAKVSEKGDGVFIATKSREAAEKLFSILASFAAAAGHPIDFRDVGSAAVDPTKADLKANKLKEPRGGVVQWVAIGGVSEKAGLETGDLILSINGLPVDNNKEFQEKVWPTIAPDKGIEKYDLEILRKGTPMSIHIQARSMESLPKPPVTLSFVAPAAAAQNQPPKLGFTLRSLTDEELKALNGKTGAVIAELAPGGEAEKAKMQVGDILVACNGKPLPDVKGLAPLLVSGENTFVLVRKGLQLTIKVNPVVASY